MKHLYFIGICFFSFVAGFTSCDPGKKSEQILKDSVTIDKEVLLDKVKGGWAGQAIGCTYGGPTEFRYKGTMIQDYVPIVWHDHYVKWWYDNFPGLYDDIYMDLTFVEVFERCGLNAPIDSFAVALGRSEYPLWHANQAARYNIRQGIMPPESGHWLNNPHADDIDYQIEADYAGLMTPGMPNTASEISDKIGHIMNYGNGWYGGVYVGAMYSLAFVSNDVYYVVTEALKTIPKESTYYQCMSDVISWYKKYPSDWKQTWFECERKWSSDIGCPDGVFESLNIDALINSAYIVIGLLYGEGDFNKTMDIATRCGQDSDCNPASAIGILGTMIGYSNIPEQWMKSLQEVEDINFNSTDISLNKAYQLSYNHALKVIEKNGGKIADDCVTIKLEKPQSVRYEVAFEGLYPVKLEAINRSLRDCNSYEFEGNSAVFRGYVYSHDENYVAEVDFFIDGELVETAILPKRNNSRRNELFWKYNLPVGKHVATFKWKNPIDGVDVMMTGVLIYSDKPNQK